MQRKLAVLVCSVLMVIMNACTPNTRGSVNVSIAQSISPKTLQEFLEEKDRSSLLIIDVRPTREYQGSHIPTSVSLDYDAGHFDAMYQQIKIPAETRVVIVDTYEHRANDAAVKLKDYGEDSVFILEGGFTAWKNQGYKVE